MVKIPTRRTAPRSITSRQIGARYEKQARQYLEHAGLKWIAANVVIQHGELDLIMQDQETLVFVEVRFRQNGRFGDAISTITHKKQRILQRTAALWLAQQGKSLDDTLCRFDVLAITGEQVCWVSNAFENN